VCEGTDDLVLAPARGKCPADKSLDIHRSGSTGGVLKAVMQRGTNDGEMNTIIIIDEGDIKLGELAR